jgi:hypothetical protein
MGMSRKKGVALAGYSECLMIGRRLVSELPPDPTLKLFPLLINDYLETGFGE